MLGWAGSDLCSMGRGWWWGWGVVQVGDGNRGWFNYRALPSVFHRHPHADGFLVINDDLLLNYWNLGDADKEKIWFMGEGRREWALVTLGSVPTRNWETSLEMQGWVKDALQVLPTPYYRQFNESVRHRVKKGSSDVFVKVVSDTFYIPQRHVAGVNELIPIFLNAKVWSEVRVQVATWFVVLDSRVECTIFDGDPLTCSREFLAR